MDRFETVIWHTYVVQLPALYSLQCLCSFCKISVIKVSKKHFSVVFTHIIICHRLLFPMGCPVSVPSHIFPFFCVTAFLTGFHPGISVFIGSFQLFKCSKLCYQILALFILEIILYRHTVLFIFVIQGICLQILCFCALSLWPSFSLCTHQRFICASLVYRFVMPAF